VLGSSFSRDVDTMAVADPAPSTIFPCQAVASPRTAVGRRARYGPPPHRRLTGLCNLHIFAHAAAAPKSASLSPTTTTSSGRIPNRASLLRPFPAPACGNSSHRPVRAERSRSPSVGYLSLISDCRGSPLMRSISRCPDESSANRQRRNRLRPHGNPADRARAPAPRPRLRGNGDCPRRASAFWIACLGWEIERRSRFVEQDDRGILECRPMAMRHSTGSLYTLRGARSNTCWRIVSKSGALFARTRFSSRSRRAAAVISRRRSPS
jgi:hypothetical protein